MTQHALKYLLADRALELLLTRKKKLLFNVCHILCASFLIVLAEHQFALSVLSEAALLAFVVIWIGIINSVVMMRSEKAFLMRTILAKIPVKSYLYGQLRACIVLSVIQTTIMTAIIFTQAGLGIAVGWIFICVFFGLLNACAAGLMIIGATYLQYPKTILYIVGFMVIQLFILWLYSQNIIPVPALVMGFIGAPSVFIFESFRLFTLPTQTHDLQAATYCLPLIFSMFLWLKGAQFFFKKWRYQYLGFEL